MTGKYIYIGAKPDLKNNHPGGQSTASLGLIDYCAKNNLRLDIIDSAQESFPPPSLFQRCYRALRRQLQLLFLLMTNRYQGVVIFSGERFSFFEKVFSAFICRLFFTQTLFFIRSGFFMDDCRQSNSFRRISRCLLRIPTFLAAQGEKWRELFLEQGIDENKIKVIHNWLPPGVEVNEAPKVFPDPEQDKLTFVFVGWLVKSKGAKDVFEAVRNSPVLQNCRVLFAGNGDLFDELSSWQKDLDLGNIELLGWQTPEQVKGWLKKSHVFILPSYSEGFPNAFLEALSEGLPAVITPVGGITDAAHDGKNAILVEPGNVEQIQHAMETFANNLGLVESYSRYSIELVIAQHDRNTNCQKIFDSFNASPKS